MIIEKSKINQIDLTPYVNLITRQDHRPIFLAPAGENHYKLLGYLSLKIQKGLIVELGTHVGTSSLALSINKSNRVVTYDVRNLYSVATQPTNVERIIGDIFELNQQDILLKADLIFLDTAHLGDFEWEVYSFLLRNDYKGILLLDDIHWNAPMKVFWNKIQTTKYDITSLGHGVCPDGVAGTGLVDFGNNVEWT